jgi:protein TonB
MPPSAHVVAPPQARRPAQSYISAADYPPVALRARQEGAVDVLLTIAPDGRIVGCNVFASSGSGSLDLAACNLLRRRARYTPARDSNGNAVVGTVREEVEWRLP